MKLTPTELEALVAYVKILDEIDKEIDDDV